MPYARQLAKERRMAGPFGESCTQILSASSLFCPSMLRYALIGL